MNEHTRWFWRMSPRDRHDNQQSTADINLWWFRTLDRMREESPVSFAGLQFDCAMKLEESRQKATVNNA